MIAGAVEGFVANVILVALEYGVWRLWGLSTGADGEKASKTTAAGPVLRAGFATAMMFLELGDHRQSCINHAFGDGAVSRG